MPIPGPGPDLRSVGSLSCSPQNVSIFPGLTAVGEQLVFSLSSHDRFGILVEKLYRTPHVEKSVSYVSAWPVGHVSDATLELLVSLFHEGEKCSLELQQALSSWEDTFANLQSTTNDCTEQVLQNLETVQSLLQSVVRGAYNLPKYWEQDSKRVVEDFDQRLSSVRQLALDGDSVAADRGFRECIRVCHEHLTRITLGTLSLYEESGLLREYSDDPIPQELFPEQDLRQLSTVERLREVAHSLGIPLLEYGTGNAKSLDHLAAELQSGETWITFEKFEKDLGGATLRPVLNTFVGRVDLYHRKENGQLFHLVETEQIFHEPHRRRVRDLNVSVGEKLMPGESLLQAARRGIVEELREIDIERLPPLKNPHLTASLKESECYPGFLHRKFFGTSAVLLQPADVRESYIERGTDKDVKFAWQLVDSECVPQEILAVA